MAYNRTLQHFTSSQELATQWATAQSYIVDQIVLENNVIYICEIAHTSGTFATDLAAGKWTALTVEVPVTISNGGTGQTTQQAAINALAGNTNSGQYLRGNGTNVTMSAIQAADVPTLNQNTTGTASNVTGVVAIANGGTGQTTQTAAFDALAPTTTAGDIIVYNGTDNVRQGVGSDGQVLVVDTSQTNKLKWATIAQGAKNYITYGTFENGATTGWSLAHSTLDSTTKLPNQASASWTSATSLAASAISSGQLAGTYSLQLSATASTTAGDMLVTDALTLDLEAQSTIQTFSFYYKVSANGTGTPNFSGTSSNSVAVAIYDVTNSAWIQPAGVFNLVQSSGVGRSTGTFQVPSNCTSVRLAVYFPNSTAASAGSPFTVIFDDFVLGPQTSPTGAAVSDWQIKSPNGGGWTTNTTYSITSRRVGDSAEFSYKIALSGAPNAATLVVNLPAGMTMDASKIADASNTGYIPIGYGLAYRSSVGYKFFVYYQNSTQVTVAYQSALTGASTAVNATSPVAWASGDIIDLWFTAPILGWSSNTVMSNDTDTRVVAAFYYKSSAASVTANTQIDFDTKSFDTHGAVTTGASWKYTAPVSGIYKVSVFINSSTAISGLISVYKNGVNYGPLGYSASITNTQNGTLDLQLNAGDYIDVRFSATATISGNASLSTGPAWIQVERLSGPATIAASETVAASYYAPGGNLVTNSAFNYIDFSTKIFDTHGFVSVASPAGNKTVQGTGWKATIPISGKYTITASVLSASGGGWAIPEFWEVGINKNGSLLHTNAAIAQATHNTYMQCAVTATVSAVAGDIIEITVYQNSGASLAINTGTTQSFVTIAKVGN